MTTTPHAPFDVQELRSRISGDVATPGDDGWDLARAAWNLAAQQQPAAVASAENPDDVAAVVDCAREAGLRVAVQAAGHAGSTYEGLDNTLLLRTVRMGGADVDSDARRARVNAGTQWREVVEPASANGLAALSGSSPEVGIVGYTLGGGLGWLARSHGLACNRVLAIELVTADGSQVRVDADNEPELFWALRGGGGSFAAVTALEFELVELPQVYAGSLFFPFERSSEVLHAWREWTGGTPDELMSWARLFQLPPLPDIPEPFRGRSFAAVQAVFTGDEAEGSELLRPLRDLGAEIDTFAMVPPAGYSQLALDPEDPVPAAGAHLVLDALPTEGIDALVGVAGPGSGSPLLAFELRQLGGAVSRPAEHAGALSSLPGEFIVFGVGMVMDPAVGEAIDGTLAAIDSSLKPWASPRNYLNFEVNPCDPSKAFPADTWERLQRVKAQYDPDDLFRSNHPIPPAA